MRSLRQYLTNLSKEELIEEIDQLSKRFKQVNEYYQARFEPHKTEDVLTAYKDRVKREFFTRRGSPGPLHLSIARKAVLDFAKVQANVTHLIDLELFYVEQGVEITNSFGDINEPFYESVENMFERALKDIKANNLQESYAKRAKKIVHDTQYTGWGFGDQIEYLYKYYY